jgi:sugar lactone lactonase YvrE
MRKTIILTVCVALAAVAGPAAPALAHPARPTTYLVSNLPGDTPEGIAVTRDGAMYVTSVGTGAVYRGRVDDPLLHPFLPAGSDGRTQATGIHLDRSGRIFVAGYATAALFVYDQHGILLAKRAARPGSALNDLVITADAVYVTDSVHQSIWRASLSGRDIGPLEEWITAAELSPTPFFLNGIVATPSQRALLVADQGANVTYRIDVASRRAKAIAVRGADGHMSGDGLLLEGHRLYGVYATDNGHGGFAYQVRLVELDGDFGAARVIADSPPAPDGSTPTTLARDRGRLLWVNSQLDIAPGTPPYTVTEVPGLR